jgi:hypothetical protein
MTEIETAVALCNHNRNVQNASPLYTIGPSALFSIRDIYTLVYYIVPLDFTSRVFGRPLENWGKE